MATTNDSVVVDVGHLRDARVNSSRRLAPNGQHGQRLTMAVDLVVSLNTNVPKEYDTIFLHFLNWNRRRGNGGSATTTDRIET